MTDVAIVTGASLGFGRAAAAALADAGWSVIVDGRDASALARAAAEIGCVAVRGDVRDPVHRRSLVDAARRFGRLDLLVNNASTLGPSPRPSLADFPLGALGAVIETNVLAPLGMVQEALPLLREARGAVVNVTSDAAVEGYEGWGGYGASKAALEQLSRVLAAEEPDVSVWWADPGDMRTRMHQEAYPTEDIGDRPAPESVAPALVSLVRRRPPSGRIVLSSLLSPGAVDAGGAPTGATAREVAPR